MGRVVVQTATSVGFSEHLARLDVSQPVYPQDTFHLHLNPFFKTGRMHLTVRLQT